MSVTSTAVIPGTFSFRTLGFRSPSPEATPQASKPEITSPFLSIPYDVRHMIYKMVLQPEFPLRRWEHYMTCPGCNLDITGSGIAKCTNILLANKQVYAEACPILHNVEHLIEGLQKPEEGLWRKASRADNVRVRRSGGVGRLTEQEARPLSRVKFDVTFENKRLARGQSWRGDDPWAYLGGGLSGWDMGGEVEMPPPPPTAEGKVLHEEVKDLVRVLEEGAAIRKLRIRMKRWPQGAVPAAPPGSETPEESSNVEESEVSVQMMVDIFQPLVELKSGGLEDVEVVAEVMAEKEECSQVHEFTRNFNQRRREYVRNQKGPVGNDATRHSSKKLRTVGSLIEATA